MPRRLPSLFAEQEQRLRFCQAQLEDLDRIIEVILQPLQSMRLSIAMLLQHMKAFMQMGASKHPNYLDELLQYLESPSIKLTSYDVFKHSGSDYDFQDRFEDFPSSMSCVQQAIAVLGWTQVSLHGCEHEVGDSFANSIVILQELLESSNQSEKMAESNKRKPDRQEPKPQKARSVHDPQIPAVWPKVTDSSGLVGAEVSQICGGLTMHKMIPQSEGESTLHTSSAMKAIVGSNMGDSMLLSDPRGLLDGNDRLLDQREVAQLSRDLHIKETLFPIDKEPVQFAVSVYIEKSTGILTMLVEEIRFEASVDMAVSITQEIPEIKGYNTTVHKFRCQDTFPCRRLTKLVSLEITPFRKLIALVEAKQYGENHFMLMVELPEVSVGQHGEYDDLSFYPLEKMQNNFYRIQRFRANPTRTLVGVVQDVDFLGIVPIIPDWQLNEFDDLETEEKLSIQLVSDDGLGCQLIDYCFDSWKNLNKLEESEQAIIAESIYSSGKCYYLKQSLKTDGIVNETSVKLTSQAQGNTETSSPTTLVPVAVAISPNGEQTGLHFVWVLCLSTKTTAENGATNESPSFGKYSVCTLTVRGWKYISQDGEDKLEEMKITGNSHTMKLDLSLGSLVQVGLDSRMVTVGSSCPQGLGSTPVRLVACLGGVGKSFILNLTKTGEESNIWGLQAVELDLPGGTEGNNSGYSNYKLRPTSVFSPARSETGLSYKDIENTEMDQERTFEKLDYRVGLYNQQIAHDLQLVFKARRE